MSTRPLVLGTNRFAKAPENGVQNDSKHESGDCRDL